MNAQQTRRRVAVWVLLGFCAGHPPLHAQVSTSTGAQVAQQAQTPPANSGLVNALTQAAVQQGVLSCASRINQVSQFLGFGAHTGAMLMLPPNQPDQRIVPMIMEVPQDKLSTYVSVTFAPNQANGCGATYDAVNYWPDSCDAVAAKQFSSFNKLNPLRQNTMVLDGGIAMKIFLMPAGNGCVSIKKEVVL